MKILEMLEDKRVASFALNTTKTKLIISEMCDVNFEVELTKEQVRQMIDELNQYYNAMTDTHINYVESLI